MSRKSGIKKGSLQALSYAESRKKQEEHDKLIWTAKCVAYTEQEILDAVAITLHIHFGWSEKRLFDFHERFEEIFKEIHDLRKSDQDDEDGWHSTQKIEDALKAAWGKHYTPREQRYDIRLTCPNGQTYKL